MATVQEKIKLMAGNYQPRQAVPGIPIADKGTKLTINTSGSRSGRSTGRGGLTVDLSQVEGLEKVASEQEYKPPVREKVVSALRKIGGILNADVAVVAGGVKGALNKDMSIGEGIKYGLKNRETFGFSQILKEELGYNPKTKGDKFVIGAVGFVADVLFSPLTYLTFGLGAGLKKGGQTLTKQGTKLYQKTSREVTESITQKYMAKGLTIETASKIASKKATPIMESLVGKTFGTKGITESAARQFIKEGIADGTVNTWKQLGPQLIDKGGVKMFGKTLVKSSTLKNSPVGKAASRIFKKSDGTFTAVGEATDFLKQTLGKTFITDFGKNPKLVNIIDRMGRQGRQAFEQIVAENKKLFSGLTDDQMTTLFDEAFKKKLEVITKQKKIEGALVKEISEKFPDFKIKDPEKSSKLITSIQKATEKKTGTLQRSLSKFETKINNIRKKREIKLENSKDVLADRIGDTVAKKTERLQQSLNKILKNEIDLYTGDLQKVIDDLKSAIVGDAETIIKESGIEVTEKEFDDIVKSVVMPERDELELLIKELEQEVKDSSGKEFLNKPLVEAEKLTKEQLVAKKQGEIIDVQNQYNDLIAKGEKEINDRINKMRNDLANRFEEKRAAINKQLVDLQNTSMEKTRILEDISGARTTAKASQKTEKITFDDPAIQKVSDQIFEGDNSLVSKLAKLAEIDEKDAIKFYIPSIFDDKIKVKNFAVGNKISSSDIGYRKKFYGYEEGLVRDPFKAFSTRQIQVSTNRIKDSGFLSAIKAVGSDAEKAGLTKVTRKNLKGEVIEGWFPKEVAEELNKFLDPKLSGIDELARATGFDWATGLFKGYVTSLFPGFHMRNLISNQFLNMIKIGLDVLNPSIQSKAAKVALGRGLTDTIVTKTGQTLTLQEVRDMVIKESDILSESGAFGKVEQFLDNARAELTRKSTPGRFNPLSRENIALKTGRNLGQVTEAQSKMVSVISALIEGKTVKEGIKQAEEALFNYGKLTDFERKIMRRMIPFYSFARKNFEFQMKALATKPGAVASQLKFFRGATNAMGEEITEEDLDGLPSWVLEGVGIKNGVDEYGRSLFFSGFGLPIEEFLGRFSGEKGIVWNFLENVLTQTNPIVKYGVERATEQDFFRGRPITEVYNAQDIANLMNLMPGKVGEQMKELIEFKEIPDQKIIVNGKTVGTKTKYTANPFALHFLRNIPTSRIMSTYGFMASDEEANMNKMLRFFTGVKGWTIDIERQKFFEDMDRKKELTDWLIRMGVVKEYSRAYVPGASSDSSKRAGR